MSALALASTALIAALVSASVIGVTINRRSGVLRETSRRPNPDTSDLGLSTTGPTVVHFSADWCGPCASVRRVVDQVCADLPAVTHIEIDIDANPTAARRLSVLSLPTTFIFDTEGKQRYRSANVPKAAELKTALRALLT